MSTHDSADPSSSSAVLLNEDRPFFLVTGAAYSALVACLTLTISPYFALGWDVKTFIAAGWSLLDWQHPFALYEQSRAAFYWPYAYPPLHAILVAPFLALHRLVQAIPESVLVRLPVVAFDLAMAFLLYHHIAMATSRKEAARLAAVVWLFNPVTLYQTAVQAHFESEWVLLVLVAYALASPPAQHSGRSSWQQVAVASLCLTGAILIKQIALIYAIPYWLSLWFGEKRRQAVLSGALTATLSLLVCLPFALHSQDFVFMVTSYVADMPVQTQSALVWLLLFKEYLLSSHTSAIFVLRYSTLTVAAVASLISLWASSRRKGLQEIGMLITLVFFLLSSKVMGYYYAILIPFAILVLLPRCQLRLLQTTCAMLAWILLSPYYASWAQQDNAWIYAALGTLNSLFFAWLFWRVWHWDVAWTSFGGSAEAATASWRWDPAAAGSLVTMVTALGLALVVPTLAQPAHDVPWVPGRQDLSELVAACAVFSVSVAATVPLFRLLSRTVAPARPRLGLLALTLYFPLTFMQFYVTRESTRVLELLLRSLR